MFSINKNEMKMKNDLFQCMTKFKNENWSEVYF